MRYRKRPVEVEATQWWKNGDHPEDGVGEDRHDPVTDDTYKGIEGSVVGFYRSPDIDGQDTCKHCARIMHDHGWIQTLEGGFIVCPGDFIITGVAGERYPCKPDIFEATYEQVQQ